MKNYLFHPFKDDDDKIQAFKQLQKDIKDVKSNNCLTLFMGRLESYYDNIISTMKSDYKKEKSDYYKDMSESYKLDDKHGIIIDELKKENRQLLIIEENQIEEIKELEKKLDTYKTMLHSHKEEIKLIRKQYFYKDYEGEAREYFSHNPKAKSVSFYMFEDYESGHIYECDDPICTIYNNDNV